MFQTTANPSSLGLSFDAYAQNHGNSCFRTWPTFVIVDYVHNALLASARESHDPLEKKDRNDHIEKRENVRAELQDLLRNAYIEAAKAKLADRKMAGG